jgi:RNA polymerase sigma-70 factor (ECF subfamily)
MDLLARGGFRTHEVALFSRARLPGMGQSDSTCWSVIRGAAAGVAADREDFVHRYDHVIRTYLAARWRNSSYHQELDDAVQEVFLECFREGGILGRADPDLDGGFRAFLYGVARNIALRVESRRTRHRRTELPDGLNLECVANDDATLSKVFDKAWAACVLGEAGQVHAEQAKQMGPEAIRRVDLLRLRFQEGLPIRDIAGRWEVESALLHREYAKARQEFKAALLQVLAFHCPGSQEHLEQQCADLLAIVG